MQPEQSNATIFQRLTPLASPFDSSEIPFPSVPEFQPDDKISTILQNANQLPFILTDLMKDAENTQNYSYLVAFLEALSKKTQIHLQNANLVHTSFLMLTSVTLNQLFKASPLLLEKLLTAMKREQCRECLKHFIKDVNNWMEQFYKIFLAYDKSFKEKIEDLSASNFLHHLLTYLSEDYFKQWIIYAAQQASSDDWAYVLLFLKTEGSKKHSSIALDAYITIHPLNLSQESFLPCLESLTRRIQDRDFVTLVLKDILQRFYQRKKNPLIETFCHLTIRTQCVLLNAMTPKQRAVIFKAYQNNTSQMNDWLNEFLNLYPAFEDRFEIIRELCQFIPVDQLDPLLHILSERNSAVGPYLFLCLTDDLWEEFVLMDPRLMTKTFAWGLPDQATRELLNLLKQSDRLESIFDVLCLNLHTDHIQTDPLTPSQILEKLKIFYSEDQLADYQPFIDQIPPVFIGLLAFNLENQEFLIKIVRYLSKDQMHYLITTFSFPQIITIIDRLWLTLPDDHRQTIIEFLNPQELRKYCSHRLRILQQIFSDFLEKLNQMQMELSKIEEGEWITYDQYTLLDQSFRSLNQMIHQVRNFDDRLYHSVQNYGSLKISFELSQSFKPIIDQLMRHRRVLDEIKHHLIKLENEDYILDKPLEEEDLTISLYSGFWTHMREGVWPYLGISPHSSLGIVHAGQLNLIGIRSNRDLEYLGISQSREVKLENIVADIQELLNKWMSCHMAMDESSIPLRPSDFSARWSSFINIKLEGKQLRNSQQALLEFVKYQHPDHLNHICYGFYSSLKKLDCLTLEEKRKLKVQIQKLKDYQTPESISRQAEICWIEGLQLLKNQYPLFCLQRYLLSNVNLKSTWEKFHAQGCTSISMLIDKKIISTRPELIQLEKAEQRLNTIPK